MKKYFIFVLGCQMNKSDAERVSSVLADSGLRPSSEKEADLIVVVACSVRQSAVDRLCGLAGKWQKIKGLKTVLTGCVLPLDREKLEKMFDFTLKTGEIGKLGKLLGLNKKNSQDSYFNLKAKFSSPFSAFIPIMTGCDNFCSYCVVPYVRGREISRPAKEIIRECEDLIGKNYKEIILLGQNVNSYHSGSYDFPKLLAEIDRIKGDFWLRFATSHPKDFSLELIKIMAQGKHLTPYLHLPVQSGDREVLKKMNRHYTPRHYLDLITKARKAMPQIMISTDIIVGFPGETKKQFLNTAGLMKKANFDMAHIARYSPRSGTKAFSLKDNVPKEEKKRREKILTEILAKTALKNNLKIKNEKAGVLVEKFVKGRCFGRTDTFKNIAFESKNDLTGKFVEVKVIDVTSWNLKGKI